MAWTALPKLDQVPASKPALDTFTKSIGFTPNIMANFPPSPIAFNSGGHPAFPAIKSQLGTELGTLGIDRWLESVNGRAAVQRRLRASKIMLRRNATQST